MSDKIKHPAARARIVADRIVEALKPVCTRIEIAGSLRRGKAEVGDIEILYIPKTTLVKDPQDLFGDKQISINAADIIIHALIERGSLAKRTNVNGSETWGQWNKLATAVKTGIPVDLFAATEITWWNNLVSRTGSAEHNIRVAAAAQKKGYTWHSTSYGFEGVRPDRFGERIQVTSEHHLFEFLGMPYLEPHER